MMPPDTLLSSPMMAFCTVFDSDSSTTRSNGLSWASSRLPKMRSSTTSAMYTTIGRSTFSAMGRVSTNMSWMIGCIALLACRYGHEIAADDDPAFERRLRALSERLFGAGRHQMGKHESLDACCGGHFAGLLRRRVISLQT